MKYVKYIRKYLGCPKDIAKAFAKNFEERNYTFEDVKIALKGLKDKQISEGDSRYNQNFNFGDKKR